MLSCKLTSLFAFAALFLSGVYTKESADTPKLVRTSLHLTWEVGAPNGQERFLTKINGTFPGPELVFDEGDLVEITVYNDMPHGTTVHWHGINMDDSPWCDGVPGLSQMPIAPGEDFIYRFKAEPAGQYWYHSHTRASLMDGLYGSLFVRRKEGSPEPWHLISDNPEDHVAMAKASRDPKVLLISDWHHATSEEYLQVTKDTNTGTFCSDSILINGKGSVYCPGQAWLTSHQTSFNNDSWDYPDYTISDKGCYPYAPKIVGPTWVNDVNLTAMPMGFVNGCVPSTGPTEVFEVDPADGWASLNFISAATLKLPIVGIDNHTMWIYEIDGQLVEPMRVDTFIAYAGERYGVMVRLDQRHQDYPLRIPDSGFTQLVSSHAIMRYKSPSALDLVQTEGWYNLTYRGDPTAPRVDYTGQIINGDMTVNQSFGFKPYPSWDPSLRPARHSDEHFVFDMTRVGAAHFTSMVYPHLFPVDHNATAPLLYHPDDAASYDPRYIIRTHNGSWVDLVLQVSVYPWWPIDFPHAMHKHGRKFWAVGKGRGVWNYSSVEEAVADRPEAFNFENPPMRDTFTTGFTGEEWLVLRYQVTSPGAWLFHCHIETHLAFGMAVAILDGVDKWPNVPPEYAVEQNGHLPKGGQNGGGRRPWAAWSGYADGLASWCAAALLLYWRLCSLVFSAGALAGFLVWRGIRSKRDLVVLAGDKMTSASLKI